MDLSDISKEANRKIMKADTEKLREKVSRETAKIIKLKVGQDTVYWELKERLAGVEREHERLQQNMVELQMQHEALSATHQEELRRRPETLARLEGTREICDVLEEQYGRIRATLQRCAADRTALCEAYALAAESVAKARDIIARRAAATDEKLKMSSEHGLRLAECVDATRQQAEAGAAAARAHLAATAADAERLREQRDTLVSDRARLGALLEEREKMLGELRNELRRAEAECAAHAERTRSAVSELERQLGAVATLRSALEAAEARGQAAEREAAEARNSLLAHNQEARLKADEFKTLAGKYEDLLQEVDVKVQSNRLLEARVNELQHERDAQTEQVALLDAELRRVIGERDEARAAAERSTAAASSERVGFERELSERADTIARLMRDVTDEAEARARSDAALSALRTELEDARVDAEHSAAERDGLKRELSERAETIAQLKRDVTDEEKKRARSNATLSAVRSELEEAHAVAEHSSAKREDLERQLSERADTIARLQRDVTDEAEARARSEAALSAVRSELEEAHAVAEHSSAKREDLERQLSERADTIARLMRDVTEEAEARARSDAALAAVRAELEEAHAVAKRSDAKHEVLEREIAVCGATLAQLMKDVSDETEARARSDAALAATRSDLDEAKHKLALLDEVVKSKDREAAERTKIILEMRREKEQLQDKICAMQGRIDNIQKELSREPPAPAPSASYEPPEHDDNAMQAPPPKTLRDSLVYNIISDGSENGDMLDPVEVNRRFEALARGEPVATTSLRALKRRHRDTDQACGGAGMSDDAAKHAGTQARTHQRTFFKSRQRTYRDGRLMKNN